MRPAFVWDLRLDAAGQLTSAQVYRAMVRSVERLDYAHVQAAIDAGTDDERFLMLREIGERRIAQERARGGGASLPMPEQQVTARDGGGFTLEFRPPVAAEEWNAQVSLLTGMAAATMMLDAGVGVLRTMPASSIIVAAAMPVSSETCAFRLLGRDRRPELEGEAPTVASGHLLLGHQQAGAGARSRSWAMRRSPISRSIRKRSSSVPAWIAACTCA